jgi:hypothetical protein
VGQQAVSVGLAAVVFSMLVLVVLAYKVLMVERVLLMPLAVAVAVFRQQVAMQQVVLVSRRVVQAEMV